MTPPTLPTLPTLVGDRVIIRPGTDADAALLGPILADPAVSQWWGEPASVAQVRHDLARTGSSVSLVIEVGGAVAGGIQFQEELTPKYRHAGIDVYLAPAWHGQGLGPEAVRLVARYLVEERGHHRITIDPAAANQRAIAAYAKAGFRTVGVLRSYERGPDGTFHDGLLMDLLAGELR